MTTETQRQAKWWAGTFGRTDELPITWDDATALAEAGSTIERYRGSHVFREGDPSDAAYVVQTGEIELYRSGDGRKGLIARLGVGSVIGDIAVFQNRPYLSSARALTHARLVKFPREELMPLLTTRPIVAMRWLVASVGQLESTQRSLIRMMSRTIAQQVADLLIVEMGDTSEVALSQAAIAELLGASRQSVNEAIGRLKDSGAVETGYGSIRVIDESAVRHMATCEIRKPELCARCHDVKV